MDVIFLSWIYLALGSTIRILTEFQQGYKLNLYKQLAFIIILFVSLFVMASILILLDKSNLIKWPWQWAWVQQVRSMVWNLFFIIFLFLFLFFSTYQFIIIFIFLLIFLLILLYLFCYILCVMGEEV